LEVRHHRLLTLCDHNNSVTAAVTGGLLLYRIAKANGEFLGRIRVRTVDGTVTKDLWVPISHADGSNPAVPVESPAPGVFVFRLSYPYLYVRTEIPFFICGAKALTVGSVFVIQPNAFHYTEQLVNHIFKVTKRTNPESFGRLGDRPWNLPGPRHVDPQAYANDPRPTLKAIILDFASVAHIDVTSAQNLFDVRKQLDRYASPDVVEWHFANVQSPWVKRGLAAVGFGKPATHVTQPLFTVAEVGGTGNYPDNRESSGSVRSDIEQAMSTLPVLGLDRQAFHVDVPTAVEFVLRRLENQGSLPTGATKVAVDDYSSREKSQVDEEDVKDV
jgi:sodium-independent sulfate anion transporter 11